MFSEADVRMEINEALGNKGWKLTGEDKNVFAEQYTKAGYPDYILKGKDRDTPLAIIEAKRKGKDLNTALEQAKRYAKHYKAPIIYASDGSSIKTLHLSNLKPLMLNGEEVDEFIPEKLALLYLDTNEYNTIDKNVIQSRKELIQVFSSANKELRKEGLQAGIERFSEFCNILFLKLFSEQEEAREKTGKELRINKYFRWNFFKNKDGNELLSYVNDTVFKHFKNSYRSDIFSPLQIKNPVVLKRIIDKLSPLHLIDINLDIKGDAFEYFLKAYLAKQQKDLGEYFTPRHIVKTLVKLINPKFGETIYDPFCGTGGMLIEVFRHIYNKMPRSEDTLNQLKNATIYGGEITKNARITKMNMILIGDGHSNIKRQDSIANPSKKKHDIVITNMPFSLGNLEEHAGKYILGSANGNSLCIEHCFDAINQESGNARIGIIVPEGILFDKKFTKLRKYIYENSTVKNIISLPSGAFQPYTNVKTSILYLTDIKKKKKIQKALWFFTVKNDGYILNTKREKKEGVNDLDLFLSFYSNDNELDLKKSGFEKLDMGAIKDNKYISIPNPYKVFSFNTNYKIIALEDLVNFLPKSKRQASYGKAKGLYPFFTSSAIQKKYVDNPDFTQETIIIGDGGKSSIHIHNKFSASDHNFIIRTKSNKILNKYLYFVLKGNFSIITDGLHGATLQNISKEYLKSIRLPVPSLEEQTRIVEELTSYQAIIDGAKQVVKSWKPYFEIDDKWQWVRIRNLATTQYGYTTTNLTDKGSTRYLRTTDIIDSFNLIKKGLYLKNLDGLSKYTLEEGDICITRSGSVGKSFIYREKEPMVFASYLVRLKFNSQKITPLYFISFANTDNFQKQVEALADRTAQPNLNAEKMKEIILPLPPQKTQKAIVKKLEKERQMIEYQKKLITLFKKKMQEKINKIWEKDT